MIYYIIFSFFFCALIYFLPQGIWDFLFSGFQRLSNLLSQIFSYFANFIPGRKLEIARKKLLKVIKLRESDIQRGVLATDQAFPSYLFFSGLLDKVLRWSQSFGGDIESILKDIKVSIIKEGKSQRKVAKEVKETLIQMSVVSFTIWGFVACSKSFFMAEGSQQGLYIGMASMHISGVIGLMVGDHLNKKGRFDSLRALYQCLYGMYLLQKVGLSFQACLREVPLEDIWALPAKFAPIKQDLQDLLHSWKNGDSPTETLKWLIDEVDFLFEEELLKAQKIQGIIKFFILSFFYLPSYFLYLGSLFDGFLAA